VNDCLHSRKLVGLRGGWQPFVQRNQNANQTLTDANQTLTDANQTLTDANQTLTDAN